MKTRVTALLMIGIMLLTMVNCGCEHHFKIATCQAPKTWTLCGETEGVKGLHQFLAGTCVTPRTCSVCGMTNGYGDHQYTPATCTSCETCKLCGKTNGSTFGHHYLDGTCRLCGSADPNYVARFTPIIPKLPLTVHEMSYRNAISSSVDITAVESEFNEHSYDDNATLEITVTGTKTYEYDGNDYSMFDVKLYNESNVVVGSSCVHGPKTSVGESFYEDGICFYDLKPGTYRLEFLDCD